MKIIAKISKLAKKLKLKPSKKAAIPYVGLIQGIVRDEVAESHRQW